jgi:hypothetical protein
MNQNQTIKAIDNATHDVNKISAHDDWEAGKFDHLKQSVTGTFKLAEVVHYNVNGQAL